MLRSCQTLHLISSSASVYRCCHVSSAPAAPAVPSKQHLQQFLALQTALGSVDLQSSSGTQTDHSVHPPLLRGVRAPIWLGPQPPIPAIVSTTAGALCSGLAALPANAAAAEVRMCGYSSLLCRPSPGQHAGPLRGHWSLPAALPHPAGGEARHVQPRRRALRHAAPHRRAPPRLQLRLPRAAPPHTTAVSALSN